MKAADATTFDALALSDVDRIVRLVPAIARQVTARVMGSRSVVSTARVVAAVASAFGMEADIISIRAVAHTYDAWSARRDASYAFGVALPRQAEPQEGLASYPCVEAGGLLIDACLDLLSVPGGTLSLRPSWMELPVDWYVNGQAVFRHQQTAAVVRYCRSDDEEWNRDPEWSGDTLLIGRLAAEAIDMCEKAAHVLAGAHPPPHRWVAITDL